VDIATSGGKIHHMRDEQAPAAKRFDRGSLFEALQSKRAQEGLSWRELAANLKLSDHTVFTRLAHGQTPGIDTVVKLCDWLGLGVDAFVDSPEVNVRERTMELVRKSFKVDDSLTPEDAAELTAQLDDAYGQIAARGAVGMRATRRGKSAPAAVAR
jgi:transcriptional regulator with XRE-family HTH domain